jgi:hypothetical protein
MGGDVEGAVGGVDAEPVDVLDLGRRRTAVLVTAAGGKQKRAGERGRR